MPTKPDKREETPRGTSATEPRSNAREQEESPQPIELEAEEQYPATD